MNRSVFSIKHPGRISGQSAALLLLLLAVSCAPPEIMELETGTFEPSEVEKEAFFENYAKQNPLLSAISGRATVQVSEPGGSERLTVHFKSDRSHSLLELRNSLGIEGGRIYSDPDSVVIYNRLEEEAHKMSHRDAAWFYLNGITALNLIRVIQPLTGPEQISEIYESDEYYLVETEQQERHYIERDTMTLLRTEREVHHPEAYHIFQFENHAVIEGHYLPRRLRILSYDEKSNIFLVVRSLEVNPDELEFDPDIPGDLELVRI